MYSNCMSENSKMVAVISIVVAVIVLLVWSNMSIEDDLNAECMERGASYITDREDLAFFCKNFV